MNMRPPRKFWLWVCLGSSVLVLIPVSAILCWLFFPSLFDLEHDNVRTSSPLDPILASQEFEESKTDVIEDKARFYVLQQLPIGITETQVLDFVKQNFTGGREDKYNFEYDIVPESLRGKPYICIKAHEWGSAAGFSYWEVVFFLTPDRKLVDVVIGEYDSYL